MASQTINAKVLTIGDVCRFKLIPAVGKTSLMLRYVKNQFSDNYNVTVGVEFLVQKVDVNGKTIALQLWDTVVLVHQGRP